MKSQYISVFLVAMVTLTIITIVKCASVYEYGVDKKNENIIVNKHNEYRQMIAQGKVSGFPKAKNMKTMKYDEALAKKAQNIANSCIYGHVRVHDGRWIAVGQNLYAYMSSKFTKGADWAAAIKAWYDEYPDYRYGDKDTNAENGHFTQVIWANTEFVGCGYTHCPISKDPFKYHKIYVCNYGPAGNFIGQVPYEAI